MDDILDNSPSPQPSFMDILQRTVTVRLQKFKDRSAPYTYIRWAGLALLMLMYLLRVYLLEGFYIITYGLGIFLLNLFIGFLTPIDDMDNEGLPSFDEMSTRNNDPTEFKPFARRLGEFSFWYSCLKAVLIAICMTFFGFFDIPVFWPILLLYFIVLFVLTMKRQIKHMIQHKYVPFDFHKKRYGKNNDKNVSMRNIAEDIRSR